MRKEEMQPADSLMFITSRPEVVFVRGQGLLVALELGQPVGSKVVDEALKHQLLVNSPRPSSLRFMPALNVTRQETDTMLSTLEPILRKET